MGTSKRYAHVVDRRMSERIRMQELERLAAEYPLQSLTPAELGLDREPLTRDPQPRQRVRAWVRFGPSAIDVDAVVHVWTERAIGIAFVVGETQHKCWVWSNAATPLEP